MASRDSGTVRPAKRRRVFLAAAVVLLVCVLAAGAVSAEKTICVNTEGEFWDALGWSLSEDTKIVVMGEIMLNDFIYQFQDYNHNLTLTTGKDTNHTISWELGNPALSQYGMFHVKNGKHLTITGNGTGTLTLNGNSNGPQTLIMIGETGYFTLGAGGILANNTATDGGAVCMTGGMFTMDGGTIANNTASEHGGAVYMTGGTFEMSGGSITNNTAEFGFGGALCVDGDNNNKVTITLSDTAKISNNTATNGGGVFMKGSGTKITLSGTAEISNNKAVSGSGEALATGHGGGVHVDDGTFSIISDSVIITNNKAKKNGGGVYMTGGTFTMEGGTIANNTATSGFGGALSVDGNNKAVDITLSGTAKISNNTATNGGGVFMKGGNTEITLSDNAEISNNQAVSESGGELSTGHGGGVHVDDGAFSISDSVIITNNEAKKDGGGVYVHFGGTFVMSGGEISDNMAATNGGGVCADTTGTTTGTFEMSGGTISGNRALYGNGVYVGGIFNIKQTVTVQGVYLPSGKNITVIGELSDSTAVTGIIPETQVTGVLVVDLAKGSDNNYLSMFKLDDSVEFFALKDQPSPSVGLYLTPIYTVTFNANGGTPEPKEVKVVSGNTVKEPEITQEGYTLEGWYNNSMKWNFTTDVVTDNIILEANWTRNTYIVSFQAYEGTPEPEDQTVAHGDTVAEPGTLTKEGHTFVGWHKDAAFQTPWDFTTPVTKDLTLYAKWIPNEPVPGPEPQPTPQPTPGGDSSNGNMDKAYRVLFNDGAATLYVVTDLSAGDKVTKPEDPVKDGYTFAGWHKDTACTQPWDFNDGITGDMTLYAKWTAQTTVTPTATATVTPTVTATTTQTATPTGDASPAQTSQPDNEGSNGETTKTSGISLPYLIGGVLILLLAILLLLIFLLRHTVTFLIPTGGELEEYRIKVWHGRYINTEDLPDLLRTAAWYRDPARQERWYFDEDRVTKSIELYLG